MARSIHRAGIAVAVVVASLAITACGSDPAAPAAGDKPTFKFAVVAEQTGNFGPYGLQLTAGVKAAVKDLNASGNYPFTLEPTFYDCQSDQAICVSKTRQAITSDKMPVVMGPIVSLNILPSAQVTMRAKVPHLVMAVLPQITNDYTNTFRWSTQNERNNESVVNYVKAKLKPGESVAIVHANTDFGNGGAQQQDSLLKAAGITPAANIGHDPDQADYTPVMVELKKANPRYVLLSDSNPADVAKLLRQAKETNLPGEWIGADAAGSIALAGDAANGYMTVSPWFPDNAADPNSAALTAKLKAEGVKDPGWIAGMAYDATKGVAEAAKAKGTTSADVMAGLSSLTNMPGMAAKSWTFSANDHKGLPTSTIAVWTGTGYKTVWPEY